MGEGSRRLRGLLGSVGGPVVLLVGALVLWEVAAARGWVAVSTFSSPSLVWAELRDLAASGALGSDLIATLTAMLVSLAIGIPLGVFVGLLLAAVPAVDRLVSPFLVPLNSIPRIALAPLFVIWFGITMNAKVAVAVSIVFFMVLFNAKSGIKSADTDMMMVARMLGIPRWSIFRKVVLPGSVPAIFAGVRLSVTYSLLGVVATEMVAARDGLGLSIVRNATNFNIGGVFAVLLVLAVFATVLAFVVGRAEKWILRWQ
ncbi:ABC transporter permease [Pseudonocardia xishanensis]|uniref:ABC transporter permease n=1 Tax=Pseudonocardia xishanensis TaxID=630995 RepID=UPI0031EACDDE